MKNFLFFLKLFFILSLLVLNTNQVFAVSINLEVTVSEGGGGVAGAAATAGVPAAPKTPTLPPGEIAPQQLVSPAEQPPTEVPLVLTAPATPPSGQGEVAPSRSGAASGGGGVNIPSSTVVLPTQVGQAIDLLPQILQAPAEQAAAFVQQVIQQTQKIIRQVRQNQKVQKVMKTPAVDISTKVMTTAAVGTAVASGAMGLMPLATSLPDFAVLPVRIFSLLGSLFIRRKKRAWGTVYDSVTKQPLDPAYVVLKDKDGKEVDTKITDMTGRFGFLVPPGEYYIEANKTHYGFPSKKIMGSSDEIYDHLYHGELLKIVDPAFIDLSIPMDQLDFDWNEAIKNNYVKFDYRTEVFKRWLPEFMFFFGFALTIATWILGPTTFNQSLIWFFIALFFLRKFGFRQKGWGLILDKETRKPVAFANLKIFYANLNQQIHRVLADVSGRYLALVESGEYDILIEEKQEKGYRPVEKYRGIKADRGLLNKDLFIDRDDMETFVNPPTSSSQSAKPAPVVSTPPSAAGSSTAPSSLSQQTPIVPLENQLSPAVASPNSQVPSPAPASPLAPPSQLGVFRDQPDK